jgi:peptide/nickel transport system permease protein
MHGWTHASNMTDEKILSLINENILPKDPRTTKSISIFLKNFVKIPTAVFGLLFVLIIFLSAILAPWIVPHDPNIMDYNFLLSGFSREHLLGTDQIGRDTLSRLIYGSRIALIVSFGAIMLSVLVGVPLGLISVHFKGPIDNALMRLMDALVVFPSLVIAIALSVAIGSSLLTVVLAIAIANVPWMARIVRSQGLIVREQDYIKAAQAGGYSNIRIIFIHIFPNSVAPIIVQSTLAMGYAVLTEAGLGFIGIGVQPPTPTWGNMIQQAFPLLEKQPLLSIVPGAMVFFLVLSFNFIGDALRDLLDPRLKGVIY